MEQSPFFIFVDNRSDSTSSYFTSIVNCRVDYLWQRPKVFCIAQAYLVCS